MKGEIVELKTVISFHLWKVNKWCPVEFFFQYSVLNDFNYFNKQYNNRIRYTITIVNAYTGVSLKVYPKKFKTRYNIFISFITKATELHFILGFFQCYFKFFSSIFSILSSSLFLCRLTDDHQKLFITRLNKESSKKKKNCDVFSDSLTVTYTGAIPKKNHVIV